MVPAVIMTKKSLKLPEKITKYLHQDWRIWFALIITFVWITAGTIYISNTVTWAKFGELPIAEMGGFLEGAFAPLAFLWLVIGLFLQQKELANNNEELRKTNIQSERQTQAIAATELNARQETFFKIAENTKRQLGSITGMLFVSSQGSVGDNNYSEEAVGEWWHQLSTGDNEVFARRFLMMPNQTDADIEKLFYGTDIRRHHTANFIATFDRLMRLAKECDMDNIISDALWGTGLGLLYRRIEKSHPTAQLNPGVETQGEFYLRQIPNQTK